MVLTQVLWTLSAFYQGLFTTSPPVEQTLPGYSLAAKNLKGLAEQPLYKLLRVFKFFMDYDCKASDELTQWQTLSPALACANPAVMAVFSLTFEHPKLSIMGLLTC